MKFFHHMRMGRVVIKPSVFDYIKEVGQDGFRRVPKWGKTATFKPIGLQNGYRYKNKTWRGEADLEGELAALLMTHPRYGVDFIAFSDDGGDADLLDSFFERKENGTVYCWLTDRDFVNEQGAQGHRSSNAFQEAVEAYLAKARESFSR